jgi:Mg/Co/Ni transporter MgtE
MVVACLSGARIPILMKTFGQEPAQLSSISLTTVTDVVSFAFGGWSLYFPRLCI